MSIRLSAFAERLRGSLFFVPMAFVLGGGSAGLAMVEVDRRIGRSATSLPFVLTSTVESAREVLSVVASATITVAGIAFSVALLVIQQASSQYSPRVVHSLFRDPFNRRVMGLAVGTFTYCLLVLRAVRTALVDNGEPVVPNLSVSLSVVLGVVAILAIVAFIDHNAHAMEASAILRRVTDDTLAQLGPAWGEAGERGAAPPVAPVPAGTGFVVPFASSGWLQQTDSEALLDLVPDGGTVRLETVAGRYAVKGAPLCTVWPAPHDPDQLCQRAQGAARLGVARTMQQDPSYGIRQLVDVALIALSPGVNDPTTAQDAVFHLAALLGELLVRDPPPALERDDRGRRLLHPHAPTHEDLVDLGFDELRRAAAGMPAVCAYLLEALHLLDDVLRAQGLAARAAPLAAQARLVLAGSERADLLPEDRASVRRAYERCFGASGADPRGAGRP